MDKIWRLMPKINSRFLGGTPPMRVGYVSSYSPRKCGIASFCKDLTEAIDELNPTFPAEIVAMNDRISQSLVYDAKVKVSVRENEWEDYQLAVEYLNRNELDLVCLQHEFGIYGENNGEKIISLMRAINKPMVVTLHTVVPNPSDNYRRIIQEIYQLSTYVVVMLDTAIDILVNKYELSDEKIRVIHHGVPSFVRSEAAKCRQQLGFRDRVVMTSINLVSKYKGLEMAIRSLPKIIEEVPNLVYCIVGETHPNELTKTGGVDVYRQQLQQLIKELGVESHVKFVNKYLSLEELKRYILASDFYVTPYIDPQQITSGALAYAIGAGKVCISTPYIYAKEMLSRNRGVLVPFDGSAELSAAVIRLVKQPALKAEIERLVYQTGKQMTWTRVAREYLELFERAIRVNALAEVPLYQPKIVPAVGLRPPQG